VLLAVYIKKVAELSARIQALELGVYRLSRAASSDQPEVAQI
jgi:hypothetical protein